MECVGPAYAQDVVAPVAVHHFVQFGDRETCEDRFGFHYDFLGYVFEEGEHYAEAIHYRDEPGEEVAIRILRPHDYGTDFARRVLIFLAMRFERIVIQPKPEEKFVRVPDDLRAEILAARDAHMKKFK